jgi:hypothetical protein
MAFRLGKKAIDKCIIGHWCAARSACDASQHVHIVIGNPKLMTDENTECYRKLWGAHSIPDQPRCSSRDHGNDFDGILAVCVRLNNELGVQVDAASSTSLSKEAFSAIFKDSQGNIYRHNLSKQAVPHLFSQRRAETHRQHKIVKYDSVFLILMLLWEQLRKEHKNPAYLQAVNNNGCDSAAKFASRWCAFFFVPWIKGLSTDHYQVVDVVKLAISIAACLQWNAQVTDKDTGYLSWPGFSLDDFDSTMVGAKVAKLAFQYLPSVPFL